MDKVGLAAIDMIAPALFSSGLTNRGEARLQAQLEQMYPDIYG